MNPNEILLLIAVLGAAACGNANADSSAPAAPVVPAPHAPTLPSSEKPAVPAPSPDSMMPHGADEPPAGWRTVRLESMLDLAGGPVMAGSIDLPADATWQAQLATEELVPVIDIELGRVSITLMEHLEPWDLATYRRRNQSSRILRTEEFADGYLVAWEADGTRGVSGARGRITCGASNLGDDSDVQTALMACRSLTSARLAQAPVPRPRQHRIDLSHLAHLAPHSPRAVEITLPHGWEEEIDANCEADEEILSSSSFRGEGTGIYVTLRDAETAVRDLDGQKRLIRENTSYLSGQNLRFRQIPRDNGGWALFYTFTQGSSELHGAEVVYPALGIVCGGAPLRGTDEAVRIASICDTLRPAS